MAADGSLVFGTAGIPRSTREESTEAGVERIHELGLGCMEVEFVRGVYLSPEEARAVGERAGARAIRLSAHAPYFVNFNAREPQKVAASRNRVLSAARMTALLGGSSLVFHGGFYLDDPPPDVYSRVKQGLERILATLRADGISVSLRPEVTGKRTTFGSLDEVLDLSAELDGVAPAVDFPHWYARTGESNSCEEFAAILQHIEDRLGRSALDDLHIHVSGIEFGRKGERRHVELAESDFDFTGLLRALKEREARGLVICESPNREEDALLLQRTYEGL